MTMPPIVQQAIVALVRLAHLLGILHVHHGRFLP